MISSSPEAAALCLGPRRAAPHSPVIDSLPVLVVSPYSRCNCRCVMCDIWQGTAIKELSRDDLERQLFSIRDLKVQWVVFSGGEALMHPHIFELCSIARKLGARVSILSTGLLLGRFASQIVENVDDVIVSLDGPERIHDPIRRVPGAFKTLAAGVQRILDLNPGYPIASRCTVQRANCEALLETVFAAREINLRSISFLAVDVHSAAFNRPRGLTVLRQSDLTVAIEQIPRLETQLEMIVAQGYCAQGNCEGFVLESPIKLRRIAQHFRAHWNLGRYVAPACNAPWKSAVVEADGSVRPCFFHPPIGTLQSGNDLRTILNSPSAIEFRSAIDVPSNPLCRRCVCSLNWKPG